MTPFRCKDCGKEFPAKRKGIPGECDDPTRNPQGCPIERVTNAASGDGTLLAGLPSQQSGNGDGSLLLKYLPSSARAFLCWGESEEELHSGSIIGRNGVAATKLREDVSVSREHAQIEMRDGCWWIHNISQSASPLSIDGLAVLPQRGAAVSPGKHNIAIGTSGLRLVLEVR